MAKYSVNKKSSLSKMSWLGKTEFLSSIKSSARTTQMEKNHLLSLQLKKISKANVQEQLQFCTECIHVELSNYSFGDKAVTLPRLQGRGNVWLHCPRSIPGKEKWPWKRGNNLLLAHTNSRLLPPLHQLSSAARVWRSWVMTVDSLPTSCPQTLGGMGEDVSTGACSPHPVLRAVIWAVYSMNQGAILNPLNSLHGCIGQMRISPLMIGNQSSLTPLNFMKKERGVLVAPQRPKFILA